MAPYDIDFQCEDKERKERQAQEQPRPSIERPAHHPKVLSPLMAEVHLLGRIAAIRVELNVILQQCDEIEKVHVDPAVRRSCMDQQNSWFPVHKFSKIDKAKLSKEQPINQRRRNMCTEEPVKWRL